MKRLLNGVALAVLVVIATAGVGQARPYGCDHRHHHNRCHRHHHYGWYGPSDLVANHLNREELARVGDGMPVAAKPTAVDDDESIPYIN